MKNILAGETLGGENTQPAGAHPFVGVVIRQEADLGAGQEQQ